MFAYQGKTALITGASSGIGEGFARRLAEKGCNLVLVARSRDALQALVEELEKAFPIQARIIVADLSREGAAQEIHRELVEQQLVIDILLNNAGFGVHGAYETIDPGVSHQQTMVNVVAIVDLTHLLLPQMVKQGSGVIINIASTSSFQPVPYMAIYGASKAFVLSFSEALWYENRNRGVRVVAVCPGPTATQFFARLGTSHIKVGPERTVDQVVNTALKGVDQGRSFIVDGTFNRLRTLIVRFLSRKTVTKISGRISQSHA